MSLQFSFLKSNGFRIRYGLYTKSKNPEHFIFLLPGRGEYIEKYEPILPKLELDEKTAIVLVDHRGQGESEGHPYHILTYNDFSLDIKNLIEELGVTHKSYSIIACSMGGLITLYGTLKKYFSPKKIFLICPFIGLPKTPLWYTGSYLLSSSLHNLGLGKKRWREYRLSKTFEENLLTENLSHYKKLQNPLHKPEEGSFSWVKATMRALYYINFLARLKKLPEDITFCVAKNELVVSNNAIYRFIQKIQKAKKSFTLKLYSFSTKHELFFDKDDETKRLFKLLNLWINKKD